MGNAPLLNTGSRGKSQLQKRLGGPELDDFYYAQKSTIQEHDDTKLHLRLVSIRWSYRSLHT